MENGKKPVANPSVLLREEFDDWAVLFDPDTNDGFGLSPTGVYLWKLLDGERSIDDMVTALCRDAADVPEEAGAQIFAFVEELAQHGLVTYGAEQFQDGRDRMPPRTTSVAENLPDEGREAGRLGSGMLRYEKPRLELLTLDIPAEGTGCGSGGAAHSSGYCHVGTGPGVTVQYCCKDGNNATSCSGATTACNTGTNASGSSNYQCGLGISAGLGGSSKCGTGSNGGGCSSGTSA